MNLIVSRHPGAIEFVTTCGYEGTVVEHFNPEMVEEGMVVIGVLPLHLAAEVLNRGGRFIQIIMPNVPAEMRGQELTPEEMLQYGATLMEVTNLQMEEVI
jgi:CRISPR-associated protein Csx16